MPYARITHHYADNSTTELEVGCESETHPDLLDELTARVLRLNREVCNDEETDVETGD